MRCTQYGFHQILLGGRRFRLRVMVAVGIRPGNSCSFHCIHRLQKRLYRVRAHCFSCGHMARIDDITRKHHKVRLLIQEHLFHHGTGQLILITPVLPMDIRKLGDGEQAFLIEIKRFCQHGSSFPSCGFLLE
ncbi:hypothetical protein D3C75_1012220 [compost metagenome]